MTLRDLPVTTLPLGVMTVFLLLLPAISTAQQKETIAGEYYLEGVMETASGFKLETDGSFRFFFSYGALDRQGSGKWTIKGDSIILNSKPYPGRDFRMISSSKDSSPKTTIKLEEKNSALLKYTYCFVKAGDSTLQFNFNEDGELSFPSMPIDTLHLVFEFCERVSSFPVNDRSLNNYRFAMEPWLLEVFFKDFALKRTSTGMEGKHPLLSGERYIYRKE